MAPLANIFTSSKSRSARMDKTGSLIVNESKGTTLFYYDSGAPSRLSYTTIFALHGVIFTSPVWSRVAAVGRRKGLRIVGVNRRGYKGSTAYFEDELFACMKGNDEQKAEFVKNRGTEVATFMYKFTKSEKLPPVSPDGKNGGIAVLGWSGGAVYAAAAVAHIDALPDDMQECLCSYIRGHILLDAVSISYGLPIPPKSWSPQFDHSIPESTRFATFKTWITSYFDHGDLSTRDINVLEYVVPSMFRTPSIYNMTRDEIAEIIDKKEDDIFETPFFLNCLPQLNVIYKKCMFDKAYKQRFPHLKTTSITGDATASYPLAALWSMQDDDKANGGGNIKFIVIPGANHFMHWDEPEKTVAAYLDALS